MFPAADATCGRCYCYCCFLWACPADLSSAGFELGHLGLCLRSQKIKLGADDELCTIGVWMDQWMKERRWRRLDDVELILLAGLVRIA